MAGKLGVGSFMASLLAYHHILGAWPRYRNDWSWAVAVWALWWFGAFIVYKMVKGLVKQTN